ncbi:OmpA family protein [uncultured Polaribacter sp.]|uniref:OmpA family protein n=1 Tax=uncultured Polaribacter sp. TaxID=174711 RepID=UPI0026171A97|nr:OmpA family protein [uncultured Polaribacter sp.]
MKHLKLAMIALFMFAAIGNINAQDENNPWAIGFGGNIVDFYGSDDFGTQVEDALGNTDWNVIPSISRISADKYLNKGFSLQLAGSLNKIETILAENDANDLYWAVDAIVKYDLNHLVGETGWFDPYVYLGGGYVDLDSVGEGMLNAGVGFNTWFNDNLGLNFQTGTKLGFSDNIRTHYQTTLGLVIRFGGKDTDKDGVYDKDDACPEVAGLKEFNGCPDADGDGIKDSDDACPNVAGLAAMNGCPDADGDGVADKDDMCPNEKGTKANKGCPDSDGDGVINKKDKCPNQAGPMANSGCPWPDSDKDGVLDKDDKCPNVAGVASNKGCPAAVITKEAESSLGEFAKAILFNSGKSSFKPGVTSKLNAIVKVMKNYPNANFLIEGHTDSQGSAALNLRISEKRATAVRDYLVKNGIPTTRLQSIGYGEGEPIATNKTRAGRAQNRRVVVKVTNKK